MSTNNSRFATEFQLDSVAIITAKGIQPLNKLMIELNI
jgi:hypothetical protein